MAQTYHGFLYRYEWKNEDGAVEDRYLGNLYFNGYQHKVVMFKLNKKERQRYVNKPCPVFVVMPQNYARKKEVEVEQRKREVNIVTNKP